MRIYWFSSQAWNIKMFQRRALQSNSLLRCSDQILWVYSGQKLPSRINLSLLKSSSAQSRNGSRSHSPKGIPKPDLGRSSSSFGILLYKIFLWCYKTTSWTSQEWRLKTTDLAFQAILLWSTTKQYLAFIFFNFIYNIFIESNIR